jgi:hypothetical protein
MMSTARDAVRTLHVIGKLRAQKSLLRNMLSAILPSRNLVSGTEKEAIVVISCNAPSKQWQRDFDVGLLYKAHELLEATND